MNKTDSIPKTSAQRFRLPICDKIINTEISNDYTLPDYQAEIRRILRVGVSALPPAKFISGSSAEFNGVIDYDLVYVGSDGGVYSAPLSAEYSFTVPLEISSNFDLNEGVISICKVTDDTTTARVSAPRKLSIKSRLSADVKAYAMMIAEESCVGDVSEEYIERLYEKCPADTALTLDADTLELSLELPLSSDSLRVANTRGCAIINECNTNDGYLDYSGELILKLLVCQDQNPASSEIMQKKIPFSDRIECDDLSSESVISARAHISDININVEDSKILATTGIIPELIAHNPLEICYTRDLYSTQKRSEVSYKTYKLPNIISTSVGNFSQSERIPLSETPIQHLSRIVDMVCKPYTEKSESEGGKHLISGGVKYYILLETNGEFSAYEIARPFKYECAGPDEDVSEYDTDIQVISSLGRVDGGTLCLDTELSVKTLFKGISEITSVNSASFGESIERSAGDVIICYPSPDDTVWSVAKKYAVPVRKISSMANYVLINA